MHKTQIKMNKKESKIIISKLRDICDISKNYLLIKQKSETLFEIHIKKTPQEREWLCLENIISEHNLRLNINKNFIIIY